MKPKTCLKKPHPSGKRRQVAAAETYKKTHCGCSLYNACIKSFVYERGGYSSGMSLYESMRQRLDE